MGKAGSLYMWSILPSKPVFGLKGDAFAWCTFLTRHGHGKCSRMHQRAAGTAWQWRGCHSPALNMNMQEPAAASSVHPWGPGTALDTCIVMGHATCHSSCWTANHHNAGKAQIGFAWLSPNPPDCISLPFTSFSQQAAKSVSKISWTKTTPKEQLMAGAAGPCLQLWSFIEAENPEAEQMPHSPTEKPFLL